MIAGGPTYGSSGPVGRPNFRFRPGYADRTSEPHPGFDVPEAPHLHHHRAGITDPTGGTRSINLMASASTAERRTPGMRLRTDRASQLNQLMTGCGPPPLPPPL